MIQIRTLRERHRLETKELILAAARAAFVRDGHAGFTMRELARDLGCSPGAIYLHFGSKEELLHCLVEESFATLLHALAEVPTADDPVANLRAKLLAYVEFGLGDPVHYHFAFLVPAADGAGALRSPHEAFEVLRRSVRDCIAAGRMPAADEETASQALWAAIHGITSLLIARPAFPWVERERLIACVVDSSLAGLRGTASGADAARKRRGEQR